MKAWLKRMYRETERGGRLLFPLVRAREWLRDGWRSDQSVIARQFARTFGYPLDWENPRTLNEKLNWLNAHYLKLADNARLTALVQPRLEAPMLVEQNERYPFIGQAVHEW